MTSFDKNFHPKQFKLIYTADDLYMTKEVHRFIKQKDLSKPINSQEVKSYT